MLVMAGGLALTLVAYQLVPRWRRTPLLSAAYEAHTARMQRDTFVGSALFGVGWGVSGVCPGPAIAGLGAGNLDMLWSLAGLPRAPGCRAYSRRRRARAIGRRVDPSPCPFGLSLVVAPSMCSAGPFDGLRASGVSHRRSRASSSRRAARAAANPRQPIRDARAPAAARSARSAAAPSPRHGVPARRALGRMAAAPAMRSAGRAGAAPRPAARCLPARAIRAPATHRQGAGPAGRSLADRAADRRAERAAAQRQPGGGGIDGQPDAGADRRALAEPRAGVAQRLGWNRSAVQRPSSQGSMASSASLRAKACRSSSSRTARRARSSTSARKFQRARLSSATRRAPACGSAARRGRRIGHQPPPASSCAARSRRQSPPPAPAPGSNRAGRVATAPSKAPRRSALACSAKSVSSAPHSASREPASRTKFSTGSTGLPQEARISTSQRNQPAPAASITNSAARRPQQRAHTLASARRPRRRRAWRGRRGCAEAASCRRAAGRACNSRSDLPAPAYRGSAGARRRRWPAPPPRRGAWCRAGWTPRRNRAAASARSGEVLPALVWPTTARARRSAMGLSAAPASACTVMSPLPQAAASRASARAVPHRAAAAAARCCRACRLDEAQRAAIGRGRRVARAISRRAGGDRRCGAAAPRVPPGRRRRASLQAARSSSAGGQRQFLRQLEADQHQRAGFAAARRRGPAQARRVGHARRPARASAPAPRSGR